MQKKLFAFDMDGTLLNTKRLIQDSAIKTLTKALDLGHQVVFCTGKSLSQLTPFLSSLPKVNIVATMNGSVIDILDKKETIILAKELPSEVVADMVDLAKKYKRELQWSNDKLLLKVYFGSTPEEDIVDQSFFSIGELNPDYKKWDDVKELINIPIYHIAIKIETSKIDEPFKFMFDKYAKTKKASVMKTGEVYVDVDSYGISKFNAIKKIQEITGLSNDNTYCFGDSDNDLSMLTQAGHSICMGNGTVNAKAASKHIIGDNDSNAISEFIENILGEN
ncbi:MAG: HAD family hydrolase [Mycoplasma sp.]